MRNRQRNNRGGFTLIEVLATLSIIGALLALIIPAVQAMRESSRRMTCATRLKQIGVAIHGYESIHNGLPPIARSMNGRKTQSVDNASPLVELLPLMDQAALAEQIESHRPLSLTMDSSSVANQRLRRLVTKTISGFRCPSDPGSGLNNFVFCLGSEAVAEVDQQSRYWGDGPFPLIASLPLAEIRDGQSNTAAVSERLTGSQDDREFDHRRDYWYSGADSLLRIGTSYKPNNEDLIRLCDSVEPRAPHINVCFGWSWAFGRYDATCYNHVVTPNSKHTNCATMAHSEFFRGATGGIFRATSEHRGGVNQLMMDGSVRFLNDAVSVDIYQAIGTRSGKEIISDVGW